MNDTQLFVHCMSSFGIFAKPCCHNDLSSLALFRCCALLLFPSGRPRHTSHCCMWALPDHAHTPAMLLVNMLLTPAIFSFPMRVRGRADSCRRVSALLREGSRLSATKASREAYRIHCAAFIQAGPIRSSEGRRSVNSLLRRAGHVVLYFPLGSAVNEPLVSSVPGGTKERKQ